ncbi:hypothetical protein LHYA1_G002739 [Lachnellula hyalina]|uniref:N-acetyltransferase domain-containing protein n=1 Tax=Lachnellula hyalina TaxID=1316788 RepID=A0A8H8R4B6_9HELO|nr:uncharacterized protein LHYA1_G002739 [Lachnellula hyalina]TVY28103.1 hypothetical protein LHYA1_G002739 [Lachnellula hyalina]
MPFEIIQIPRGDKNIRTFVERYKEFRLLSLKVAPEAFGSTLERELAFTDETWYNRLANPKAVTFLALQRGRIVGSLTTIGPLPFSPDESSAISNPWDSLDGELPAHLKESHWRVNGMFTLPEVRRQGVAKALMEKVVNFGSEEASRTGRTFAGSIVVDADNPAAKTLYESAGYVVIKEETHSPGSSRTVLLMKYSPTPAVAKTLN